MLGIYFIASILISGVIFLFRRETLNRFLFSLFLLFQIGISIVSFVKEGETDSIFFSFDPLGILLAAVLSILSVATFYHSILYLKRYTADVNHQSTYYSSLVMFIAAMTGAYFARNLAVLWICIETTTLFVSVLIFHSKSKIALEASWKYLFISSVGVAIAFMGILFLSATASDSGSNTLDLTQLIRNSTLLDPAWLKISFILALTGFSIKMSLFPLYAAAIDAKTIAPSPVNALMSSALINVGFIGIFRFYSIIAHTDAIHWAQQILMIVGLISIFLASIQLFRIKRYTRMYAFSSMEHAGIVALGLYAGGIGYYAAILHIVLHSFVKSGLFYQLGQSNYLFKSIWIKDSGNYFKINPIGGLIVIIGFISVIAIPPSGLFFSEFLVFKGLFAGRHYIVSIIAFFLLTVIFFIIGKNLMHLLYAEKPLDFDEINLKVNPYEHISQFVLFAIAFYLGFNPPVFFVDLINSAVSVLL